MKTLILKISRLSKPTEENDNSWLEGKEAKRACIDTLNYHDEIELKFKWSPDNQFLLIEKNAIKPIMDSDTIELGNYRVILNIDDVSERVCFDPRDRYFPAHDVSMLGNASLTETKGDDILTPANVEVLEDPLLFLEKGQPLSDTWYHEVTQSSYPDSISHRK